MPTASHPSTHQNPECTSGASLPALRQAIFSTDSSCRLVVGYVSFGSRLVVDWWSVTCRLVVDWWSVMCRFLQATFGLNPCQSSPPSQIPLRNSIATTQNPPKPTTIPSLPSMGIIPIRLRSSQHSFTLAVAGRPSLRTVCSNPSRFLRTKIVHRPPLRPWTCCPHGLS